MQQKTYEINLQQKTDIFIGENLLASLDSILKGYDHTSYTMLCTKTTHSLFANKIKHTLLQTGKPVYVSVIDDGEKSKEINTMMNIFQTILANNVDRKAALIALGGGVVGDMATVIAGFYYRGIDCIQIPTTLVSQVDAAIGGKGAVNIGQHKNTIGIIRQPRCIVIDTSIIKSLPMDQVLSGVGEIAKYAIVMDKNLFAKLSTLKDLKDVLSEDIIAACVRLKMSVVEKDPLEQNIRATINFGHTFGHAIELSKNIPHGQAVSIGMTFAIKLSVNKGLLKRKDASLALALLQKLGLPTTIDNIDKNQVYELMKKDKKAVGGKIKFVLLEEIGKAKIGQEIDEKVIKKVLDEVIV